MAPSFTCAFCGESHDGLAKDWGWQLPDEVWAIPAETRAIEARFTSDLCQYGNRHFIRGVLPIPLTEERNEFFGWGVWAEVEAETFERYLALYDKDGAAEPPRPARLANVIKAYDAPLGHPLLLYFSGATSRPWLRVTEQDRSQLAEEQRQGMNGHRHHEISQTLGF
ncbi:DUF2199 domain-containing protein [Azospirillum sp. B4]|uniref:DUF2199 domain-containing protein n=1 Tax=Azospirillum sp. B4 TaxID=95605 RepID=UPI00034829F3|nr:DUF2199 domain-containing protein [Azospirillum sp. B4]